MRQKRQDQADPGELLEKDLTGAIIGAFYETYNFLGLLLHYGPEPEVHRLVSPRYYREQKSR